MLILKKNRGMSWQKLRYFPTAKADCKDQTEKGLANLA